MMTKTRRCLDGRRLRERKVCILLPVQTVSRLSWVLTMYLLATTGRPNYLDSMGREHVRNTSLYGHFWLHADIKISRLRVHFPSQDIHTDIGDKSTPIRSVT